VPSMQKSFSEYSEKHILEKIRLDYSTKFSFPVPPETDSYGFNIKKDERMFLYQDVFNYINPFRAKI
jgi:hypothetical protein